MDPLAGSSTAAPARDLDLDLDRRPPPDGTAPPRPKRAKTSKACNACRRQKSRCERLAGDAEGCHRCGVIGIACVFETDALAADKAKARRPRPILPRSLPPHTGRARA
ncbi:hypothetical protein JB92DRAFT_3031734 [Gautieria morchelliformis]|nr:hypothetical protein JB92DRAFT_3031734 [Gautieria morchelliformis]